MLKLFESVTYQPISTDVNIETLATEFTRISDLDSSAKFYKNSVLQTTDFTADVGDSLAVTFQSSSKYSYPTFIYFKVNGHISIVGASTVDDPTKVFNPYYTGKSYLDNLGNVDGSAVDYKPDSNMYKVFDLFGGDAVPIAEHNLSDINGTPIDGELSPENFTFMLDPKQPYAYKLNRETGELIDKFELESPALGFCFAAIPQGGGKLGVWFTLSNGKVLCTDFDGEIISSFLMTGVGQGIDASETGALVAIADPVANHLVLLEDIGTEWRRTVIPFADRPYDVYIDKMRNIWVTCKLGRHLYFFDYGRTTPTRIDVGFGQKEIKQRDKTTMTVVCTESNTVVDIGLNNREVLSRTTLPSPPIDFCVGLDSTLLVACADHQVYKVSRTGKITYFVDMPFAVYGMDSDIETGKAYILSFYPETPDLLAVPSRHTNDFKLDLPRVLMSGETFHSDALFINDIAGYLHVGLPVVYNSKLQINDDPVTGNVGRLDRGDSFKFTIDGNGEPFEPYIFPIYVGNELRYFESRLDAPGLKVDPFYFDDVLLANASQTYTSNEIVISGLPEDDFEIPFTVSHGLIILNDVLTDSKYADVRNGDHIAVTLDSDTLLGKSTSLRAEAAGYVEVWTITVKDVGDQYYLNDEFLGKDLHELNIRTNGIILIHDKVSGDLVKEIGWGLTPTNLVASNYHLILNAATDTIMSINADTLEPSFKSSIAGAKAVIKLPFNQIAAASSSGLHVLFTNLTELYHIPLNDCRDIVVSGTNIWVAGGRSGKIHKLALDMGKFVYELADTINLNGNLTQIVLGDSGKLYVLDAENGRIKVVDEHGTHINTFSTDGSPYSLVVDEANGYAYTIGQKDNTIAVTDLDTGEIRSRLTGAPSTALFGLSTTGNILIDNEYSGYHKLGLNGSSTERILLSHRIYDATEYQGNNYFQSGYIDASNFGLQGTLESAPFFEQLERLPNSSVTSNEVEVSGIIRPVWIEIEGFDDAQIIKNGQPSGKRTQVVNGDLIRLSITTLDYYSTSSFISLVGGDYRKVWHVRTIDRQAPYYIKFHAVYDALTSTRVFSNEEVIRGLLDNGITHIYPEDRSLEVYINDELVQSKGSTDFIRVVNGDRIRLGWTVEMMYNTVFSHKLLVASTGEDFAVWNIYAEDLIGPMGDQVYFLKYTSLLNTRNSWQLQPKVGLYELNVGYSNLGNSNHDVMLSAMLLREKLVEQVLTGESFGASSLFTQDLMGEVLTSGSDSLTETSPTVVKSHEDYLDYGLPSIAEYGLGSSIISSEAFDFVGYQSNILKGHESLEAVYAENIVGHHALTDYVFQTNVRQEHVGKEIEFTNISLNLVLGHISTPEANPYNWASVKTNPMLDGQTFTEINSYPETGIVGSSAYFEVLFQAISDRLELFDALSQQISGGGFDQFSLGDNQYLNRWVNDLIVVDAIGEYIFESGKRDIITELGLPNIDAIINRDVVTDWGSKGEYFVVFGEDVSGRMTYSQAIVNIILGEIYKGTEVGRDYTVDPVYYEVYPIVLGDNDVMLEYSDPDPMANNGEDYVFIEGIFGKLSFGTITYIQPDQKIIPANSSFFTGDPVKYATSAGILSAVLDAVYDEARGTYLYDSGAMWTAQPNTAQAINLNLTAVAASVGMTGGIGGLIAMSMDTGLPLFVDRVMHMQVLDIATYELPAPDYFKRPLTFLTKSNVSAQIPAISRVRVKDQTNLTPKDKGSYNLKDVTDIINNSNALSRATLSDGTYLYYYLNDEPFGPCFHNKYFVTYGYVRGG